MSGSRSHLNPRRFQWLGLRGLAERYYDRRQKHLLHTYPGPGGQQPQIRRGRWTYKRRNGQLVAARINRSGPHRRLVHVWHPGRRVTFQGDDEIGAGPDLAAFADNGAIIALGTVAALALAGAVTGAAGSSARGPGGRFVPEWVSTASKFIKYPWRYDKGMGAFIWRPEGGALGDPGLQYAIYGGTGYGRGTWSAWVWADNDESRPVAVKDGTQAWHALDGVKADYDKRLATNPASNRGSSARDEWWELPPKPDSAYLPQMSRVQMIDLLSTPRVPRSAFAEVPTAHLEGMAASKLGKELRPSGSPRPFLAPSRQRGSSNDRADQIRKFVLEDQGFREFNDSYHTHSVGMPEGWAVRVHTDRALVDGLTTIWVYPDRVVLAAIRFPLNYADWQSRQTRSYATPDELAAILREWTVQPAPAWGSMGRFSTAGHAGEELAFKHTSAAGEGLANWRWHGDPAYAPTEPEGRK